MVADRTAQIAEIINSKLDEPKNTVRDKQLECENDENAAKTLVTSDPVSVDGCLKYRFYSDAFFSSWGRGATTGSSDHI